MCVWVDTVCFGDRVLQIWEPVPSEPPAVQIPPGGRALLVWRVFLSRLCWSLLRLEARGRRGTYGHGLAADQISSPRAQAAWPPARNSRINFPGHLYGKGFSLIDGSPPGPLEARRRMGEGIRVEF